MSYYSYWGKAGKDDSLPYHLLAYHNMDVAAVGNLLLNPNAPLCQSLAEQLGVEPKWLQQWFTFCLMLHDIGKFSRCFQNKVTGLSSDLVPEVVGLTDIRHDSLGFALWQHHLRDQILHRDELKISVKVLDLWFSIVCGHHGKPPRLLNRGVIPTTLVPDQDIPTALSFLDEVSEHWLPDLEPLTTINKKVMKTVSWQLSGVAVLADWLGSDQSIFRYHTDVQPLLEYWQQTAMKQAERALLKSGFGTKSIAPFSSIQQQFDFIQQPTPLQDYAQTVTIPDSQQLFILEDVTGAGKTEAAMVLVHRLMSQGLAHGLYVGLPTMATANGMYNRLSKSYQSLFQGQDRPSLVLTHGAAQLSESFQESIGLIEQQDDKNYAVDDQSASAYCNSWLADSRKKALLADIGIGTIDQALLAILPARHQSLRMLGLKGKVLLLDEVHAYDPYMRELLTTLIQAHSAQGGSVILLSATLPHQFRQELMNAYRRGQDRESEPLDLPVNYDYPLVSQVYDQGYCEKKLTTRDSVRRHVDVRPVNNPESVIDLIADAATQGHCICWIRNTIKDAKKAWEQLNNDSRIDSERLTLFHSRFAMIDRQVIETDVLNRFGKGSGSEQRTGQILIATQVVEQSLDLDFDVMVSDLAPIDLLIQRAGRLQRHIRDSYGNRIDDGLSDQRLPPCLYIHTPDPQSICGDQWLRSALPGTQAVYSHVGQLWLTANLLVEKQGFDMPEDARDLIEGVYSNESQGLIPEQLFQASGNALAKNCAKKNIGNFNCLNLDVGYTWDSGGEADGWDEDTKIPTRLNDTETVSVALAVPDNDGYLKPLANSGNPRHLWRLSHIQLPAGDWKRAESLIPEQWAIVAEILQKQHPFLRFLRILPLVAETEHLYHSLSGWDIG